MAIAIAMAMAMAMASRDADARSGTSRHAARGDGFVRDGEDDDGGGARGDSDDAHGWLRLGPKIGSNRGQYRPGRPFS